MTGNIEWDKVDQKIDGTPVVQAQPAYAAPQAAPAYQYKPAEFEVSKKMILIMFIIGAMLIWVGTTIMVLGDDSPDVDRPDYDDYADYDDYERAMDNYQTQIESHSKTLETITNVVVVMKSTGGFLLFMGSMLGLLAVTDMEKFSKIGLTVIAVVGLYIITGGMAAMMSSLMGSLMGMGL